MPLATSTILNQRYRIVSLVGRGGFGAVYRAWDMNLKKTVALKENLDSSPEGRKQFTKEAEILAKINHPALPRVTDHFFVEGQGQYLVMDYIEGVDLLTLLQQSGRPLPENQVLGFITQVADALAYLHSRTPAVIHRDIKPQNVIITPQGQAVLVDFGIVKIFESQLTTKGARAYSAGYSPPEQYGQGGTNEQSDIYSLGATMYHLLTSQIPIESIQRTIGQNLIPPRQLNPAISQRTEDIILTAMQLRPDQRFPNGTMFVKVISGNNQQAPYAVQIPQGVPGIGGYVASPPADPYHSPTKSNGDRRKYIIGGAVLIAAVGAIAILVTMIINNNPNRAGDDDTASAISSTLTTIVQITDSALNATNEILTAHPEMSTTSEAFSDPSATRDPEEESSPEPTSTDPDDSVVQTTIPPIEQATATPPPTATEPPTDTPATGMVSLPGNGLIQLTFGEANFYKPVLSPDQTRLITFAKAGDYWQLTEIDPVNGGVVGLITTDNTNYYHPLFSRDGSRLIVSRETSGYQNIFVLDSYTGAIIGQLTDSNSANSTPFWSPDEQSFVFQSDRDGDKEIFLGFMDGSNPVQLTSNTAFDGSCSFSPDGNLVTFYSNRDGNPEIYVLEMNSGIERRLTTSSARDAEPAFSPDGQWIVFESNRDGGDYDIWAIRPDGSGLHQITFDQGNEQIPSFSPDGKWILFQANYSGDYDIFRIPWPG